MASWRRAYPYERSDNQRPYLAMPHARRCRKCPLSLREIEKWDAERGGQTTVNTVARVGPLSMCVFEIASKITPG
jgi:hypothetical protein